MQAIIAGNSEVFAEYGPGVVDGDKLARLFDATMTALDKVSALLDARRDEGFVRRCHGDLHLRNVVIIAGRPVLFDAIEFNDAISHIDVLYDLAFLLMDLDYRGLRRLANIAFNRYLDVTGDVAGLPALPLFLSLRAAIRAHVAAAMVKTVEEKGAADDFRREARAYLNMALAYLDPPPPRMLAVGGLSGSGKSRMARELAPYMGAAPGARVARSDVLRKRLLGAGPLERLGPQGYTAEMTEKTYRAVFEEVTIALASGHSAIADAVFAKPRQRAAAERLAGDAGVHFDGLWLEAPQEVMMERIKGRKDNASDADAKVLRRQLTYDLGPIGWRKIDSYGSRKETLARGLRVLGVDI
jgi:predicted kinase